MEIGSRGKHHLLLQTSPLTPYLTDEDPAHLGEQLILPPWLESYRPTIEAALPKLTPPRARA